MPEPIEVDSTTTVIVEWDGRKYEYMPGKITVRQGIVIHGYTGMGLMSWSRAVNDGHPKAVAALMWVMCDQAGEKCSVAGFEELSLGEFIAAYNAAMVEWVTARVAEEEAKEGPKGGPRDAKHRTRKATPTSTS